MKRPSKRKTITDLAVLLFQLSDDGCDSLDCPYCTERIERIVKYFGLELAP